MAGFSKVTIAKIGRMTCPVHLIRYLPLVLVTVTDVGLASFIGNPDAAPLLLGLG